MIALLTGTQQNADSQEFRRAEKENGMATQTMRTEESKSEVKARMKQMKAERMQKAAAKFRSSVQAGTMKVIR